VSPASRLLAEFADARTLREALLELRRRGYARLEVYSPFPLHGVDEALGARPSRLPRAVFVVGMLAAAGAYGLEWLLDAYLYPIDVGGRPPHMPVAYVPITFEMGVLFAGLTAFFGVLLLGRLLRPWQPIFEVDRFESATSDRFWIEVAASDPCFDLDATAAALRAQGAVRVALLEEVTS
jgi:hypothetical protein